MDNDSGADALLQATTLALSRFLTHDEQNREDKPHARGADVYADTCRSMPRHRSGGMYVSFSGRSTAPARGMYVYAYPLEGHPIIPTSADTQIQRGASFRGMRLTPPPRKGKALKKAREPIEWTRTWI